MGMPVEPTDGPVAAPPALPKPELFAPSAPAAAPAPAAVTPPPATPAPITNVPPPTAPSPVMQADPVTNQQLPAAAPAEPAPAAPVLNLGERLKNSKNPLDRMAWEFQQGYSKELENRDRKNVTHKLKLNEMQHGMLEKALSHPMTNPDGSPMMYRAKTKGGIVEKPMTLEKFVKSKLSDMGQDPDNAFQVIADTLRLAKSDFMSALNSKLHFMTKAKEEGGWQKERSQRALRKFKDYFDPKSENFVQSGDTQDIINAFETKHYGTIEERAAKATAWNEAFQKVKPLIGLKEDFPIAVDQRSAQERGKRVIDPETGKLKNVAPKGVDPKTLKDKMWQGLGKQKALDNFYKVRNLFLQLSREHPEKAKELGLDQFITPGGKYYLTKAMVHPSEDNLEADISTARGMLGRGRATQSVKPNKANQEDPNNQAYEGDSVGHGGEDDDEEHLAAADKKVVVASAHEGLFHPFEDEVLYRTAALLKSVNFGVDGESVSKMASFRRENPDLFCAETAEESNRLFAIAVREVVAALVDRLPRSYSAERLQLRTAGLVLASKIAG
jgi:hypothetical protein